MSEIKDQFAGDSRAETRYVHGIVPVFDTGSKPLHRALIFVRKSETPVPDLEGEWMTLATERWDFEANDWVCDDNLALALDTNSHNLDLYDGRTLGKDETVFFACLNKAKDSYHLDQSLIASPEI
ncbi:MAG: hypothetical protein ACLFU1_06075 [Alphaproteobacteria bacterium]